MPKESMNILLVDDHPIETFTMRSKLRKLGYERVATALGGLDAIEQCQSNDFDIVICDLDMPGMDGLAFLRHLHEQEFKGGVCIASGKDDDIKDIASSMCSSFGFAFVKKLSKPISTENLAQLIRLYANNPHVQMPKNTGFKAKFNEKEISQAFETSQLKVYYQPQYELATGEMIGCEALVRWHHPELGVLTPYVFLQQLTNAGRLDDLFYYVLERVLVDMQQNFMPHHVSVNVSHDSFKETEFSQSVLDMCHEHRIEPERLTIELLETGELDTSSSTMENFARLKINGMSLAVDDFGTGHSSLLKLASLPFNEVKIDRAFIQKCLVDDRCKSIVTTTAALANSVGASIVAEGIEDQETLAYLKSIGITYGQGYYFSKPVPLEELQKMFKQQITISH